MSEVALLRRPTPPETSTTTDDEGTVMSNLMQAELELILTTCSPTCLTIVNRFLPAYMLTSGSNT